VLKDAIVNLFWAVYGLFMEGLRKNNKNAYKHLSFDRGLKHGHPEYGLLMQNTLIIKFHKSRKS